MKTYSAKANEVSNDWILIDAKGQTLGRMASEIASRLRGKHKPEFTAHIDTGDHVVVINAESVQVTGNKAKNKTYYSHSGLSTPRSNSSASYAMRSMRVELSQRR